MQNKLNYLLLLPLLLAAQTLLCQPIGLDPTFATNGVYTFTDGSTTEYCVGEAVQSDGKVIWVGQTDYDEDEADHSRIVVMRLDTNGQPDPSFGKVYIDFPLSSDEASVVAIQADGKIVIAGDSDIPYSGSTLSAGVVYRLNANGTMDNNFGIGGRAYIPADVTTFRNMVIQPDGRIVTSGYGFIDVKFSYLVTRFNANGTLDASFGPGGKGFIKFRTSTSNFEEDNGAGYGLALQADGKILSCGYDERNYGNAVRLNPNGTLDPTFGSGGIKRWDFSKDVSLYSMAVQSDGKIVIAGDYLVSSSQDKHNAILIRLLTQGNFDTSFGPGYKTYGTDSDMAYDMEIQPDGKYVLIGNRLIRVNPNGLVDTSFDGDGYYELPSSVDAVFVGASIKLSGNKIYVAGLKLTGLVDFDGFLARFTNNIPISSDNEPELMGAASLSPNPARDLLRVTFQQPESASSEVLLEAFDLAGRVIHSSVEQVSDEVQIPVGTWPNGMYYLSITATSTGARRTVPFVVQH